MTRCKEKKLARALNQQRESRISRLVEAGRIKSAKDIPENAIPVALELQNPKGPSFPPLFYRDMDFVCEDCAQNARHEWHLIKQLFVDSVMTGSLRFLSGILSLWPHRAATHQP